MVGFFWYEIGSAYLVKNRIDGNSYVAKKMMLEGMNKKDTAFAWGEVPGIII